jgi:prephenate dehydrogenase
MHSEIPFQNILIVGLGLIGGSILHSLVSKSFNGSLYGLDIDPLAVDEAFKKNLITNRDKNIPKNLSNLMVVYAVPTLSINKAIKEFNLDLEYKDAVFTDTCSVKASVLEGIGEINTELLNKFVLSHPIAGSEKSGLSASSSRLFKDRLTIICPHKNNHEVDIKRVENFWGGLGSITKRLPAEDHDALFAKTSHLPHVISYALMHSIFEDLKGNAFLHSGGSLEDYTRIASSDPVMWKDIMIANEKSILESINGFKKSLDILTALIVSKDPKDLVNFFSSVKDSRDRLLPDNKD